VVAVAADSCKEEMQMGWGGTAVSYDNNDVNER
jgi:hypothetical protein